MHKDEYVVTVHGNGFTAASSQQSLDSLNRTMENKFRRHALGSGGPNCSQRTGKFLR